MQQPEPSPEQRGAAEQPSRQHVEQRGIIGAGAGAVRKRQRRPDSVQEQSKQHAGANAQKNRSKKELNAQKREGAAERAERMDDVFGAPFLAWEMMPHIGVRITGPDGADTGQIHFLPVEIAVWIWDAVCRGTVFCDISGDVRSSRPHMGKLMRMRALCKRANTAITFDKILWQRMTQHVLGSSLEESEYQKLRPQVGASVFSAAAYTDMHGYYYVSERYSTSAGAASDQSAAASGSQITVGNALRQLQLEHGIVVNHATDSMTLHRLDQTLPASSAMQASRSLEQDARTEGFRFVTNRNRLSTELELMIYCGMEERKLLVYTVYNRAFQYVRALATYQRHGGDMRLYSRDELKDHQNHVTKRRYSCECCGALQRGWFFRGSCFECCEQRPDGECYQCGETSDSRCSWTYWCAKCEPKIGVLTADEHVKRLRHNEDKRKALQQAVSERARAFPQLSADEIRQSLERPSPAKRQLPRPMEPGRVRNFVRSVGLCQPPEMKKDYLKTWLEA